MGSAVETRARPVVRLLRIGARCCYAAAGLWVVWLAASRWNGVPAAESNGATIPAAESIDPALDRTAALTKALAAIPPLPRITLPEPPAGMRWRRVGAAVPHDILNGEWTPETRPNLRSVVAYLQSPAVEEALGQLTAIDPGEWRASVQNTFALIAAVKLLVARARYRHEGLDDVDAAIDDFESVFRLCATAYRSHGTGSQLSVMAAVGLDRNALHEMFRMIRRAKLTRDQLARIVSISTDLLPSWQWSWRRYASTGRENCLVSLDMFYTDDGLGNGWLVMSQVRGMTGGMGPWYRIAEPRCGLWNVVSMVFNDRRTVMAKVDAFFGAMSEAANASFGDAQAALAELDSSSLFNLLDGPFGLGSGASRLAAYHWATIQYAAVRRAVNVVAALSSYRVDRGHYPRQLSDLVAEYLKNVPLDPYDDQPMRYSLDEAGSTYRLWAVGPDGQDDARLHRNDPPVQRSAGFDDVIFPSERRKPWSEPFLEPIEP